MAPAAINLTNVLFLDYATSGENHTVQIRYDGAASLTDAMVLLDAFLEQLDPMIYVMSVLGARVRDIGGVVTYPVSWSGAGTYGDGTGPHNGSANYIDFVGRALNGRRCRISMFGLITPVDATGHDFRLAESADANVENCLTILRGGTGVPVSIEGDPVNWYTYANIGVNAYWRNRIR